MIQLARSCLLCLPSVAFLSRMKNREVLLCLSISCIALATLATDSLYLMSKVFACIHINSSHTYGRHCLFFSYQYCQRAGAWFIDNAATTIPRSELVNFSGVSFLCAFEHRSFDGNVLLHSKFLSKLAQCFCQNELTLQRTMLLCCYTYWTCRY